MGRFGLGTEPLRCQASPALLYLPSFQPGFVHRSDVTRSCQHLWAWVNVACAGRSVPLVCCQPGPASQLPGAGESGEGILGSSQGRGQRGCLPAPLPAPCWGRGSRKGENRGFLISASDLRESLKARELAGGCSCRSCPWGRSRHGAGHSRDPTLAEDPSSHTFSLANLFTGRN